MAPSRSDMLRLLSALPGSYAGPDRPETGPFAVVGVGEGTLAAHLLTSLIGTNFARTGTQFVLSSADAQDAARTYAEIAEVAGATVRRVSTGGQPDDVDVLIPAGAFATYHYAQFVAHASGHGDEARAAEALLADLAARCAPEIEEGNPARDLAWSLWGRAPLLLAAPDADALPHAWQSLLARTGKTLAVPVPGDALPFVTGAFEAQHEKGDGRIALILGEADAALHVAREVLESRIDEVVQVPYPAGSEGGYAGQLALWYFGAWVAAYLAERYDQSPADPPMLARAQAVLAGEAGEDTLGTESPAPRRRAADEDDRWDDDDEAETEADLDDDFSGRDDLN
ncbi:SIS domain-containing protein [Deinococcus gobiensis]|uniref:SIS domain-containing protein n=2 Tax=Deinococcus TaxID=1298 RepID=UPI0005C1F2BF|nr:SIS domain-containing protein [Deinococcus gobiensis]